MASSKSRLLKELKAVQQHNAQRRDDTRQEQSTSYIIELCPNETNLMEWHAVLEGPENTPYAQGRFRVALVVPQTYPMSPPDARFVTPIFHPNVHFKTGEICLDILKNEWSPAWTLMSVCQAIVALMSDPAADSPLNCDAGNLIRAGDMRAYNGLARMYTIEHAKM